MTTCNHTMDSGRPCGAPPLKGKPFCYWHHRLRQDFNLPGTPSYRPPLLESPNSVVVALDHVFLAQSRNLIDPRAARHLQWTLRLALQAFRQLDHPKAEEMVINPQDFGANFGATKEVDDVDPGPQVMEAGRPRPANPAPAEGGAVTNLPTRKPPVPTPNVADAKSVNSKQSPINHPTPASQPKRGIYDPEGCLAHLVGRE